MSTICIFCKIIDRTQKADILYEDDEIIVFRDIKPAAKFHFLVVPKVHIKDPKSLRPEHKKLVERCITLGENLLKENNLNIADTISGFHWPPFNSIGHLHMHFINPASEMSFLSRMIFRPNSWWFVTPDYVLNKLQ